MNQLKALIEKSCISQRETARFLGVLPSSVSSWVNERKPTPAFAIEQMEWLVRVQEKFAEDIIQEIKAMPPGARVKINRLDIPLINAEKGVLKIVAKRAAKENN